MRIGRNYQGDLGDTYFAWQQQHAEVGALLERPKFAGHVRPTDVLVDFGCGTGFLLEVLDARERIGVEANPAARQFAGDRGLHVVESTRELAEASVDVVISNHALEHTLRPLDELEGMLRILRPGGRLVIYVPLDDWRTQRKPDPADVNHHLYTWTPLLLTNLLEEAGFEVERCRVVTYAWPQLHTILFRVLPRPVFDKLAVVWSAIRRRRQVMAVARRPPAGPERAG